MLGIIIALCLLLVAAWLLRKVILVVAIIGIIVALVGVGFFVFKKLKDDVIE